MAACQKMKLIIKDMSTDKYTYRTPDWGRIAGPDCTFVCTSNVPDERSQQQSLNTKTAIFF